MDCQEVSISFPFLQAFNNVNLHKCSAYVPFDDKLLNYVSMLVSMVREQLGLSANNGHLWTVKKCSVILHSIAIYITML